MALFIQKKTSIQQLYIAADNSNWPFVANQLNGGQSTRRFTSLRLMTEPVLAKVRVRASAV